MISLILILGCSPSGDTADPSIGSQSTSPTGTSGAGTSGAGTSGTGTTGTSTTGTTAFGPDLEAGWNIIEPGGETTCARGDPFRYAVRPGTSDRIVVEWIGGGACWDELTCGYADAIFSDNTDWMLDIEGEVPVGIYDHQSDANPLADAHHIVIPYCTGDVHWGNASVVYGEGTSNEVPIEHKGKVNTETVLDWISENYNSPSQVVATGCSAGAYGSILWSAHLADRFPSAQVVQFGDAGAGIVTDAWFAESFPSWNATEAFPAHIPSLDPARNNVEEQDTAYLYSQIAAFYPEHRFSQFHAYADSTQVFYYQAMGGGDASEWTAQMLASMDTIEEAVPNFSSYVAGGDRHCIIGSNDFYTLDTDGTPIVDWVDALVNSDGVDTVRCTGCDAE